MTKTTSPLVSVIVPVYNVEQYIDECLSSIVSQTYENLEIILVDDAASDESGKKCDLWAKKDKRIKVVHKAKNEGLNYARREGVKVSKGKWISFIDSDDLVNESYISDMYEVARTKKVDIVVCRNQRFREKNEIIPHNETEDIILLKDKLQIFKHAFVNSPDTKVFMITGWGKLFERSVIEKIDWSLSNSRANEDELEAIQFYNIQKRGVAIIKKVLYYYRDNPNSIMNKPYTNIYRRKNFSRFEWLEELYKITNEYLGKNNPYEDEILYHNVLLNLLFLNKDITKGVFTDRDAEIFIKNAYPKIAKYQKIATKYPLQHEEKRAYNAIISGGLYSFWHDDRRKLQEAYDYNQTLQQYNAELQQEVRDLQQHVKNLENSRSYRLGRAIVSPYTEVKRLLNISRK